ncbi:aldehyde dehydrogenase [uncultured Aeromicrobium sp.]|uniref:aldehyde dehydrogenase family protein n=1 Tax=uncultured Aeromicrobium sp. TaxID=337820 RepID=UPI0025CDC1BA|nr:aldehyde dehydrogenase family protein [uncultured Aeromicrobium sp.]
MILGDANRLVRSVNPSRPEEVLVEAPAVHPREVERTVRAARSAQRQWWAAGPEHRSHAMSLLAHGMEANSAHLIDLMVREVGKPRREAEGEMTRAVGIARYYAQQVFSLSGRSHPAPDGSVLWDERRPHGVVGLVTPWNFPVAIPLWKALPALAAGNAVVVKPAPAATAVALAIAEVTETALPPDVLSFLPGFGSTAQSMTATVDAVSFTGSEEVGRLVVTDSARRLMPVQAEMGGQNAAIVLGDAAVESTAATIANAAAAFAGQKCTATRRIIVCGNDARYRQVSEAMVAAFDALAVGEPADEATVVGPVISASSQADFDEAVRTASVEGRRLTSLVGEVPPGFGVRPTVIEGLDASHRLAQEELFAPLVTLHRASTLDEAVELANGVRYGLAASVHGADVSALMRAAKNLNAGMIKLNAPTTGVDFWAPFGGVGSSSFGPREQGLDALEFFSKSHTVTLRFGS